MISKYSVISAPALLVAMAAVISNSVFAQTISPPAVTYDNVNYKLKLNRIDDLSNPQIVSLIERQPWFNNAKSFQELFGGDPQLINGIQDKFSAPMPVTDDYTGLFPGFLVAIYPNGQSKTVVRVYQRTDFGYLGQGDDGIEGTTDDSYGPISIVNFTFDNTPYYFFTALPTALDTLNSFRPNAFALRNNFNLQSANIAQSLSYDCTVFDAKNICASFSGTRSNQNGSNLDSTTGTLVIAHRPSANIRFGGYINQSLNTSEQGGLRLERSKPGVGAFVNYALSSGLNIRGSVGFGKLDMQTTREALGTAEAGVGKTNITTQGAQLDLSKAFDIKAGWTAMPYAGIRKVTNKRAGYSETESDLVSTPLTFADLKQTQTTAFGGMRFLGQIAQQTQLLISAGVEHDSSRKVDDYAASGIDGLGSINMQENVKKTRPVFATSLSYDIAKNERASIGVVHRQEAFDKKRTTSVGFTYMKGF